MSSILLGVNVDHVATLRQARGTHYPDPLAAALQAESAGADGITVHLREDRRHIQDEDVRRMKSALQTRLNLEMAVTEAMVAFAEEIRPPHVCMVPEKREELTTEGGLNVVSHFTAIKAATERLANIGSEVSLFIDPDIEQIDAALEAGAPVVELHTGSYADADNHEMKAKELHRIQAASQYAHEKGLIVNAGHGLHYENVKPIAAIPNMNELNIGHALIAQALFDGLDEVVKTMKALMIEAREESIS